VGLPVHELFSVTAWLVVEAAPLLMANDTTAGEAPAWSRTNASLNPFVSPATRLLASDPKAATCPSALTECQ